MIRALAASAGATCAGAAGAAGGAGVKATGCGGASFTVQPPIATPAATSSNRTMWPGFIIMSCAPARFLTGQ
ncbi:MAG: hypothetical protein KGQ52_07150 [Alphaproteobacteria bacterium]|nr:hypothetical protein [Alphaproteobacteria bacterium]